MPAAKILCLHKVSDIRYPSWPAMPMKTFEKLLAYTTRHYDVCLPQDLHSSNSKNGKLILTFDDGYEDFYSYAWPLLQKYNAPAVLNVVARCVTENFQIWTQRLNDVLDAYAKIRTQVAFQINDTTFSYSINEVNAEMIALDIYRKLLPLNEMERLKILDNLEKNATAEVLKTPMLSSIQLAELAGKGVAIGSHSYSHINLKDETLADEILRYEMTQSKKILTGITSDNIDTFAFPNGMYNRRALKIACESGYRYILLVNNKVATFSSNDKPMILDRILIYSAKHWKNIVKIEKNRFGL